MWVWFKRSEGIKLVLFKLVVLLRESTNTGMDWNGLLEWLARFKFPVVVFHTLSNRVSIASHTAMKMHGKIVLESMEGSCVRISRSWCGQCIYAYALKQCGKHCHTPDNCRSSHIQQLHIGPSHSCHPGL